MSAGNKSEVNCTRENPRPKVAAIALVARVLGGPFGDLAGQWQQVIVVVSLGFDTVNAAAAVGISSIAVFARMAPTAGSEVSFWAF